MANATRTVRVRFDGSAAGLTRASKQAEKDLERFVAQSEAANAKILKSFGSASTGILKLGGAVNAVSGVAAFGQSIATMSGIVAGLPAVALAGAAALGTFKLATQGVGDAFSAAASGDAAAYSEAVAKLAPSAKAAAAEVNKLGPRLRAMQQDVQDNFFNGYDKAIRGLGEKVLPVLEKQLGDIALQMGQMGTIAADALMQPAAVSDLNKVLGNTSVMFDGLKTAPADVLDGILALAGAGSSEMEGLGNSIGKAARSFQAWAREAAAAGRVNEWITTAKDEFKKLGGVLRNTGSIIGTVYRGLSSGGADFLGSLEKTTAQLDKFLKSAEGQDILRELGETLAVVADVARDVLMTAIRELGPVVAELAPVAREVARAIGDTLVAALEFVGPLLQGLARFLSENKDVIAALVPLVLGAAAAFKAVKVAQEVKGWVDGATAALGGFGRKADETKGKVGKKGGPGLLGALGALAVGFSALDAASGTKITLPPIDGDAFESNVRSATSQLGKVFDDVLGGNFDRAWRRLNIFAQDTPVNVKFDTMGALGNLESMISSINQTGATIAVDGDVVPLGDAVLRVTDAINAGREYVTIDGETLPAEEALNRIREDINLAKGLVTINGNTVPAGDALFTMLDQINRAGGAITIDGDQTNAVGALQMVQDAINRGQGTVLINGDSYPADVAKDLLIQSINMSTPTLTINGQGKPAADALAEVERIIDQGGGTVTIDGVTYPAEQARTVIEGRINQTTGTLGITAEDRGAAGTTAGIKGNIDRTTGTVGVNAKDNNSGNVLTDIIGKFSKPITQVVNVVRNFLGFAGGGEIEGYARGGAIRGPGTGTSDSILARVSGRGFIRVANGEHILTAREVRAAGGHGVIHAIRRALLRGTLTGYATGGAVGGPSYLGNPNRIISSAKQAEPNVSVGGTNVWVEIDGQEFRGMIRAEIERDNRATRRLVGSGAGRGF